MAWVISCRLNLLIIYTPNQSNSGEYAWVIDTQRSSSKVEACVADENSSRSIGERAVDDGYVECEVAVIGNNGSVGSSSGALLIAPIHAGGALSPIRRRPSQTEAPRKEGRKDGWWCGS